MHGRAPPPPWAPRRVEGAHGPRAAQEPPPIRVCIPPSPPALAAPQRGPPRAPPRRRRPRPAPRAPRPPAAARAGVRGRTCDATNDAGTHMRMRARAHAHAIRIRATVDDERTSAWGAHTGMHMHMRAAAHLETGGGTQRLRDCVHLAHVVVGPDRDRVPVPVHVRDRAEPHGVRVGALRAHTDTRDHASKR